MMLVARELSWAARLHDVSAALEPGSVIAVCGPNGAGKSSLLACLAGLTRADRGAVLLCGVDVPAMSGAARAQRIGFLPQIPEIAWDLSVEVLVSLGRLPWPGSPDRAAIDRAITAMDLEPLRRRPVSRLSGGERARVLMARVLAGDPRWLLADEPLASLDLGHAAALLAALRGEARAGKGVVLALHDLALAMNHADRVIVLDRGRVAADGPPERALSAEVVARVWGVAAHWLGEPGRRALSLGPVLRGRRG